MDLLINGMKIKIRSREDFCEFRLVIVQSDVRAISRGLCAFAFLGFRFGIAGSGTEGLDRKMVLIVGIFAESNRIIIIPERGLSPMTKNIFFVSVFLIMVAACDAGVSAPSGEVSASPAITQTAAEPPVTTFTVVFVGADGFIREWTDGEEKQLPLGGNVQGVQISSDGRFIAYVRGGELFVFDRQHPDILHNTPRIDQGYLLNLNHSGDMLPEITDFYFITYRDDSNIVHHDLIVNVLITPAPGGMDIFRVSADDDDALPSRLFAPGEGGRITPSPNGRWLVVSMPNELLLTRSTGLDLETVALFDDFPAYLCIGARGGPDIVWSEDSTGFYIVTPYYDSNNDILYGESMLWWVEASSGDRFSKFHFVSQLFQPAYISPLGQKVIHLIDYGDMVNMMIAGDGYQEVLMTYQRDSAGFISWRPAPPGGEEDSSCFVFWQEDFRWPYLRCLNQEIVQLTENPILRHKLLEWVDSERFLYVSGMDANAALYLDKLGDNPALLIGPIYVHPKLPPYDYIP